jgi:outer membrane lipase/esterase
MKFIVIGIAAGCFIFGGGQAQAQVAQSGNLYEFGDSFQDSQYQCSSWNSPLGTCSNYRNTPMQLSAISGYTFSKSNDFAIGGTGTGTGGTTVPNTYPAYPGYAAGSYPNMIGQIAQFQSLGHTIGANDLVSLSYAGNDIVAPYATTVGASLGYTVAGFISQNVSSLIALGGRNFILFGGMPFDKMTLGGYTLAQLAGTTNSADNAYYTTLNSILPSTLAQYESDSVHLRILDVNTLANRALSTPSMYGFIAGDCYDNTSCQTASLAVQDQYAFYKGHPSDSFALVIAEYIQNLLTAPYQAPAAADLATASAQSFSANLLARLNTEHMLAGNDAAKPGELTLGKTSFFFSGDYTSGKTNNTPGDYGMDWHQGDGAAGAEYRAGDNLRLGLAAGYARPVSSMNDITGSIALNSYQLAAYASITNPHWFADAVLGGEMNRYDLGRQGVIDTLTASPSGAGFTADARGGYLFDLKSVQAGPIGGLTYSHISVNSYNENGDLVLAQSVGSQQDNSLSGRAGLELRALTHATAAFFDITADHDFPTGSRVITTTSEDANSAVPVYTPLSNTIETYGSMTLGVNTLLWRNIALNLTGNETFSRPDGNQRGINAALSMAF